MRIATRIFFLTLIPTLLLLYSDGFAQSTTEDLATGGSKTVVAGPQYKAGGFKTFFLGKHYRDEWTTAVDAPVLDLQKSAGGLVPHKRSGGFQSKSLSFKAAQGGRFQFRSIDKDPSAILPLELQESVVADIVRDQISSAYPYSAMVVPPLAGAVGVLHTTPRLVVLPDDGTLGEFGEDFAGMLGSIEEFVINGPEHSPGFGGLTHIIGSYELVALLEDSFEDYVDQKAFLKARLLDVFLSDWDRHFDQWRWGRFEEKGKYAWKPIPLDRDQAFAKFDGLLPALAENRSAVPQFEGIEKKKPDIWSLTFSGRHLDRILLNALTEADFREAGAQFSQQMTDEVIEEAVRQLPQPVYDISGPQLAEKLKHRRSLMEELSVKYYKNLANNVKIMGRDKADYLEINRSDKSRVEIKLFERDKDTGEKKGPALYHRLFKRGETKEIRIYLLDGNDKAVLTGEAKRSIKLRIIGGSGDDELVDESRSKIYFYDTENNTSVARGRRTAFKTGVDSVINFHEYEPLTLSYGKIVSPLPIILFNADDGLILGAAAFITTYGFRKKPYATRMFITGSYAFLTSAVRSSYSGDFTKIIRGLNLRLDGVFNPREITDYYGLGNDTGRDKNLEKNDFYRVQGNEYWFRPILYANLSSKSNFFFGATLKHFNTKTDLTKTRLVIEEQPYGTKIHDVLEATTGIKADFTDNTVVPTKGTYWLASVSAYPKAFDNDSSFAKAFLESHLYLSPTKKATFAFRARGEKVWGDFPYYEAAYLGGSNTLRGFARNRFGGDASVFGSATLRYQLFNPLILLPFNIGWFVFAETGRVWLNGESPGDWHSDFGGGIWFVPAIQQLSFALGVASSKEGLRLQLGGRFAF